MLDIIKKMIKGWYGEYQMTNANREIVALGDFVEINDLLLDDLNPDSKTSTFQIDSLLISMKTGMFIAVEAKNYDGVIEGSIYSPQVNIRYGKNVFESYNPIYQNRGHILKLQNYIKTKTGIEIPMEKFESIVFLTGAGHNMKTYGRKNLKTPPSHNHLFNLKNIIHGRDTTETIKNYVYRVKEMEKNTTIGETMEKKFDYAYELNDIANMLKQNNKTESKLSLSYFIEAYKHAKEVKQFVRDKEKNGKTRAKP